jgi:Tol biopolymer transport system component
VLVRIVDGSMDLVQVRLSDGAERALTATPDREETWPHWSDRAGRLVYQVSAGGRDSQLVLWSPDGGETPIPQIAGREARWPTWSPTRAEIVYAFRGGRPAAGVAIIDVENGGPRLLAKSGPLNVFLRPSFAPDGERVVAQRRTAKGRGSRLWLLREGEAPELLTQNPAWFDAKPRFTRDGDRVVFSRRVEEGGPRDVMGLAADGGEAHALAALEADEHSAHPSPRRDEIAFVSDRDGLPRVFLLDLDGGPALALTPLGRSAQAPRWSPDGERLVVTLTEGPELRLADQAALDRSRVAVIDRRGRILLEAPGFMPDWMPPWR